jgi:hypothetical protein
MTPQTKFTKHLHELKPLLENDDKKIFSLYQVFDLFKSKRLDKLFIEYKVKGLALATIFYQLIEMTILNFTVHQYTSRSEDHAGGKKDTYYQLKNDSGINWRMILYILVNRFLYMVRNNQETPSDRLSYMMVDDTVLPKRGKSIECFGKIFTDVQHELIEFLKCET